MEVNLQKFQKNKHHAFFLDHENCQATRRGCTVRRNSFCLPLSVMRATNNHLSFDHLNLGLEANH